MLLGVAAEAHAQGIEDDAGAPDASLADPEREGLEAALEVVEALNQGRRSEDDPAEILRVDPVDDDAVEARLADLRREVEALRARVAEEPIEVAVPADAGDLDAAAGSAGDALDAGVDAAAVVAPPSIDALRLAIAEGSISFLEEPLHVRARVVADDDASRELAQELAGAAAAAERAVQAEAEATEAREVALAEAQSSSVDAVRELGAERARALAVQRELAQASGQQARARHGLARGGRQWSALADEIDLVVTHGEPTAEVADALYDRVVVALDQSRGAFDRALVSIDAPSAYPHYELSLELGAPRFVAHPSEREDLLRVVREVGEARDEVVSTERRFRWTRAKTLAAHVAALDHARRDLLPLTSGSKRQRLLSLGPEGVNQIEREAYHLSLMARWYVRTRPQAFAALPAWFGDALAHSSSRWLLLQLLLLIVLASLLIARRERIVKRFREILLDTAESPDALAIADQWARVFSALAVPTALIIAVYAGFGLAARLGDPPELELLRSVAIAVAWYGLILSLLHFGIVSLTRAHRAELPPSLSRRILRSLRWVAGYVLFAVLLTIVDRQLVGRGYIQDLVIEFAWVGAVPIVILILRSWREEITDGFIKRYPASKLSNGLARARGLVWDVVLLFPAALALAVYGLSTLVQDMALRFDRIRRALAYLFRRRLERSAEALGHGTADVTQLPIALRRAFDPAELTEDAKVDRFPALVEVLEEVSEWKGGGVGMSLALVGPHGVGKTTWMRELHRRAGDVKHVELTLDDSLEDERAVCLALSGAFELDEPLATVEALVDVLNEMPPHMVLLDHCQNLHLRCVGGFAGLKAFAGIVRRTSMRFFWVSAFSQYAFEHMSYVAGGTRSLFTRVEYLEGWTERELGELIDKRMERAELDTRFDDLLPQAVRPIEREAELERTRQRYLRLLWDYTDGLPRVALYYWLRSLVLGDEDDVHVRLFDAPHADDLEHLDPGSRFLLHAIISHENLSVDEAVRVLGMPEDELSSLFEMLRLQGYLTRKGDRYRVTTRWDRAVVSYLRRKHLLYT